MITGMVPLGVVLAAGVLACVALGVLYRRMRAAEEALRARDELIAVAAHELKTPLTTIAGYAQSLQLRVARQDSLPRRDRDTLRVIVGQARRVDRLIDSLLDLARLQGGLLAVEPGVVDLAGLARRVADDVALTAPRHTIAVEGPEAPLLVRGDALRLEQVLWNLLQNAIKYSPAGGPVTVTVDRRGQEAWLRVRDQGVGIPADVQGRLFQRPRRARGRGARPAPRAGIGLAVVHEIVRRHGGAVEVASVEGRGSTFTVRLPLAAQGPEPEAPRRVAAEAGPALVGAGRDDPRR